LTDMVDVLNYNKGAILNGCVVKAIVCNAPFYFR